ncbi:hypothetical protein QFC21_003790 [Naganishia friedmannii]|uniref:Uncharacterized protein n=1 Tax=Naganishia friedmannii TaxID=89922 RepID=A0ACC2VLI6_9TREE|nr:hypothetical protein QFC21_003790 [Naganishia friedmannii]
MVPFALTAGLSSLGSSKLVYQGGFAELVSGAISMGIGGYLSAKGEQDIFRHRFTAISSKLDVACASEVYREVHKVLGPFGVKQGVSKLVAQSLEMAQGEENEKQGVSLKPDQVEGVERGVVPTKAPVKSSLRMSLGLVPKPKVPIQGTSAFLIKLGEGMDEVPAKRLFISAFTIGISYFLGGLIPIIPYLCVADTLHGLYWSILATGIILLVFGVAKSWFTVSVRQDTRVLQATYSIFDLKGAATGYLGLIWGAISTLAVGAAAAAASYGVVKALETRGS